MALALPERLTLDNAAPTLHQLGQRLSATPGPVVALDAAALQGFDSSAIAVLLELRRQGLAQGKTLHVQNWPERLQGLVALYGVDELLRAVK
jgi:phospholipid transport system transporter-binding protein